MNIDLRDQLSACHQKIKELTIFEENLKDQVVVNQLLCVEREQAIAEREKAIADLNSERNTIKGWCDASVTAEKIIASQRSVKSTRGLGFIRSDKTKQDTSMLKFGTFVSSIPDPNTPECSSASHTEGTPKGLSRAAKGKAQADAPSKTKVPNLKKSLKTLGNGPSVARKKQISQNPSPRLKIDLITSQEKIVIPPASKGKGLLGSGPAHLRLKKPKGPDDKHFTFRKCQHCGLKTHIASKCPSAPKAKKIAKGKNVAKAEPSAKAPVPEPSALTDSDSSPPTNQAGPIMAWVPKKT
jgi:hypothetical protein